MSRTQGHSEVRRTLSTASRWTVAGRASERVSLAGPGRYRSYLRVVAIPLPVALLDLHLPVGREWRRHVELCVWLCRLEALASLLRTSLLALARPAAAP